MPTFFEKGYFDQGSSFNTQCSECGTKIKLLLGDLTVVRKGSLFPKRGFQCQVCKRVYCWDCSDREKYCKCGNKYWREKSYFSTEDLDRSKNKKLAKKYDIFVSYSSKVVHLVREVVEQLVANGYSIWFAEYDVLIQDRGSFQDFIRNAIENSSYGLCFTNTEYMQSQYCRYEMEQLLESNNCGPENIIEIGVPGEPSVHKKYHQLKLSSFLDYRGNIQDIFDHIEKISNFSIERFSGIGELQGKTEIFYYLKHGYSLEVNDWSVRPKPNFFWRIVTPRSAGIPGPIFQKNFAQYEINGNLIIGEAAKPLNRKNLSSKNQREIYESIINFANLFTTYHQEQCLGVHLLLLLGYSHFSITTRNMFGHLLRRYSIILPSPINEHEHDLEFLFTFFSFDESFREFCRYAHYLDKLVLSLRWSEIKQ